MEPLELFGANYPKRAVASTGYENGLYDSLSPTYCHLEETGRDIETRPDCGIQAEEAFM